MILNLVFAVDCMSLAFCGVDIILQNADFGSFSVLFCVFLWVLVTFGVFACVFGCLFVFW